MECSEDVIRALCSNDKATFLKSMKKINVEKYSKSDLTKINDKVKQQCSGESILHRALKYNTPATFAFFKSIAEKHPELLKEQRISNDGELKGFEGQSPLHVAIVKEHPKRVAEILKIAKVNKITQALLCIPATGDKFKNTVLIGQLPLSVAALSCKNEDFKIIRILLDNHARIWLKNEHGDTVFHSLIRYADDYPEKMEHIKPTFKFLWNHFSEFCESRKKRKKYMKITDILFWENNSGLTPLELSAKLGVSDLFQILIDIKEVYYFTDTKDGLFDIREYDVTEFDRLIGYLENLENEDKLPILESLFDPRCSQHELFQILNIWLVEFVLEKKWMAYKWTLVMWMIVHVFFMSVFTASSITKSQIFFCSANNETSCDMSVILYMVPLIDFAAGVIYLFLACLCITRLKERCSSKFGNPRKFRSMRHNLDYIACLLLIAIGALMECVLLPLKIHWDYHLVIALISGWYFVLYFSPFFKGFVSFTFMIRSGFLKDFVPFSAISMCFMSSFTSIMYMLFHGTDNVEEFDNFFSSLFTMFNLGVGLDNIDVLNKSRIPVLAHSIFVAFTILSFIILFNALIAVMTNTFSDVHNNRNVYLKYSRLEMIELFEDIVLVRKPRCIFKFLVKKAKYWTRSDDIEPSPIYKRYIKKWRRQKAPHLLQNDITQIERESGMILKSKKRYYSLTQLLEDFDDFSDDKNEKKINAKMNFKNLPQFLHNHLQKSKGLKKVYPDKEVTLHVYQVHKSSQIPDTKTTSK